MALWLRVLSLLLFNCKPRPFYLLALGLEGLIVGRVTWVLSAVFLLNHINKHRSEASNQTQLPQPPQPSQPPPQYAPNNGQAIPMEKYNQPTVQPVQPMQPQGQFVPPPQQQFIAPYPQDPVPRQDTVSPVSQVGYVPQNPNMPEMSTPQHTGGYSPNPNAVEMMTPQHTEQYPPNASELATQK